MNQFLGCGCETHTHTLCESTLAAAGLCRAGRVICLWSSNGVGWKCFPMCTLCVCVCVCSHCCRSIRVFHRLAMDRASWRPHQLKEQLLQALDAQHNIVNMKALLEVICGLESYPMTKEALLETRLGKLINDVRKRSTDEDLVKRLKHLVRSWQKLVGVDEVPEKGLSGLVGERVPGSAQTLSGTHSNHPSQRDEASRGSGPGDTIKYPNNFRKSKIPVRAIKPHSSSIKRLQQFTSLRPSLSNQHSQDQHMPRSHAPSARHRDAGRLTEPAQPSRFTDTVPLNASIHDPLTLRPAALTVTDTQNHTHPTYDPPPITPVSSKPSEGQRSTLRVSEIHSSAHLKQSLCLLQHTHRREKLKLTKRQAFIPDVPVTELPGVSREVSGRDLLRIRRLRWHGVNGCYDNRNNWYDWTQSITLDPYGNGRKLQIMPYVVIDYRR
ncbi:mediator of RNA polymerase II transcription subunit 26-like isoform X2 [Pimephales promelas]|uniref:mediator of RNA polymerase II transcription subunit 26-like isoform X2 n=1 Tax=Pimephales promelas TaxID=90988 RepID=UPI001955C801|nr:mediator of RNA polymerase II transcription subunit 26-like isoform X2 [Pimephales promelas]